MLDGLVVPLKRGNGFILRAGQKRIDGQRRAAGLYAGPETFTPRARLAKANAPNAAVTRAARA